MKYYSLALLAVMSVGVSTQQFSCFPRMRDTQSVLPYEQRMPEMPKGTQPFAQDTPSPTGLTAVATQPIPPSPQSVMLGGYYYQYYCQMCHGPGGNGNGTVGHSYVPTPPALASARVKGRTARELAKAMVIGYGHEPVLETTVPADRRWHIVNYLHSLRPVTPPAYNPSLAQPQTQPMPPGVIGAAPPPMEPESRQKSKP